MANLLLACKSRSISPRDKIQSLRYRVPIFFVYSNPGRPLCITTVDIIPEVQKTGLVFSHVVEIKLSNWNKASLSHILLVCLVCMYYKYRCLVTKTIREMLLSSVK